MSIVFSESLLEEGLHKFIFENQGTPIFLTADDPASYYGLDSTRGLLTITPKNSAFEVRLSD